MERELTRLAIELELPPNGGPVWFYPGATTRGGHDGLLLSVLDTEGTTRLCMVASATNDGTLFSGPIEMPDNAHFYANGLLMSYDEPDVCKEVGVWPSSTRSREDGVHCARRATPSSFCVSDSAGSAIRLPYGSPAGTRSDSGETASAAMRKRPHREWLPTHATWSCGMSSLS